MSKLEFISTENVVEVSTGLLLGILHDKIESIFWKFALTANGDTGKLDVAQRLIGRLHGDHGRRFVVFDPHDGTQIKRSSDTDTEDQHPHAPVSVPTTSVKFQWRVNEKQKMETFRRHCGRLRQCISVRAWNCFPGTLYPLSWDRPISCLFSSFQYLASTLCRAATKHSTGLHFRRHLSVGGALSSWKCDRPLRWWTAISHHSRLRIEWCV